MHMQPSDVCGRSGHDGWYVRTGANSEKCRWLAVVMLQVPLLERLARRAGCCGSPLHPEVNLTCTHHSEVPRRDPCGPVDLWTSLLSPPRSQDRSTLTLQF